MKKIISLLIVFAVSLSFFIPFSSAEEEGKIRGVGAGKFITALNIGDFSEAVLQDNMTRQEFAKILYKITTGAEFIETTKKTCVFSDVTDDEYIPYVNAMYEAGLIGGFSDGTFKGEQALTATEAVTFIIRAIGYDVIADAKGGYPSGYLNEAKMLGFFSGFEIGMAEPLTKGDTAIILKNALTAEINVKNSFSTDGNISFTGEKTTLLYSIYGAIEIKGIMEGIDITRLYGESSVPPWHVDINGNIYDIGETSPNHLLGLNVTAYYYEENNTLIYIEESEGKNKTVSLNNEDVISIGSNKVIVDIGNGKIKEYTYGKLTHLIYNSATTEDALSMELISGFDGSVTLIDNNMDNNWDVIKIDASKDYVVDYVDSVEKAVYDKNSGEKIVLDTKNVNPYVRIEDENGTRVNVAALKTNDVLTVFESRPDASQGYIRAVYSNAEKSVAIEEIYEEEGKGYLIAGEDIYITTRECFKYSVPKITLGEQVTLLLNANGKVAGIDFFNSEGQQYGILIKCQIIKDGLENKALLRIMNRYGVVSVTEFSNKVSVDGIMYNNDDEALFKHLKAASVKDIGTTHESVYSQVIKYSLDEFGKINAVDTIIDGIEDNTYMFADGEDGTSGNMLYRGTDGSGTYYSEAKNIMGGVVVSSDTVIFVRPALKLTGDEAVETYGNEENYGIKKSLSGTSYYFSSYYEDISKISASAITINESVDSTTSAYNTTFSVFDKLTLTVDEDGVSCYKLYFWQDGSRKSKLCNKNAVFQVRGDSLINSLGLSGVDKSEFTADKLKKGDMFRYSTDNYGKISAFDLFYRADGNIKIQDINAASWANYERIAIGYVYRTYSDGLSFVKSDDRVFDEASSLIEYMKEPDCAILIYDSSKPESQRISLGTAKDAKAFSRYGADCSVMLLQSKYGNPRAIYVIR